MRYAIQTLWFERRRYLAGILAVAFSAVLMAVQGGVLVGLVATVSAPVDQAPADIWVAIPHTPSADNAGPLSIRKRNQLMMLPQVAETDEYVQQFSRWHHPDAGYVLVIVCGVNLSESSLGPLAKLTPEMRVNLSEPGAVVIDERDKAKLGIKNIGDKAQINKTMVKVVGFMQDMGSMTGCYVFCSLPTARQALYYEADETTYLLARTHEPGQIPEVLKELNEKWDGTSKESETTADIEAYSKTEFSAKSRWYWILKTKSGLAVGFTAALGLLVGAVVTSQTLYSATATLLRELAVLKALGVPRWRMNLFVVEQALVIGFVGLVLGVPLAFGFEMIGNFIGTRIDIAGWLLWGTIIIVLSMALFSGLLALRALNNVDPAELLR